VSKPPEPDLTPPPGRRLSARDAIVVILLAVLLLVLFEGSSIRRSGEDMQPGTERDLVEAVGAPAGWVADRLPFDEVSDDALAVLGDDADGDGGGFQPTRRAGGVPPVPPESFDPEALGAPPPERRPLRSLLVTGDSLSMPLDAELARRLAGDGIDVERDPHVGTGISKTGLADWGELAAKQTADFEPDAVVMFVGANEGFPLPGPGGAEVRCCGAAWAAEFAYRARSMIDTYRRDGRARVYWLNVPAPRNADRARISRAVNAAIAVAAEPYRADARVLDMSALFTPEFRYRDAMEVDGHDQLVREPDGIHLNGAGAELAADAVLGALQRDFVVR
jgi:lysophospholipase L1-like esterase